MNDDIQKFISTASPEKLSAVRADIDRELASRSRAKKPPVGGGKKVITFTDGASRGNPGLAGIGVIIFNETGDVLAEEARFIGECTNNEAEYRALILALDRAYDFTQDTVECNLDSELVVRQMIGRYAVKSPKMIEFFQEAKQRAARFKNISFRHVPRENPRQQLADKLANKGIDEGRG